MSIAAFAARAKQAFIQSQAKCGETRWEQR